MAGQRDRCPHIATTGQLGQDHHRFVVVGYSLSHLASPAGSGLAPTGWRISILSPEKNELGERARQVAMAETRVRQGDEPPPSGVRASTPTSARRRPG